MGSGGLPTLVAEPGGAGLSHQSFKASEDPLGLQALLGNYRDIDNSCLKDIIVYFWGDVRNEGVVKQLLLQKIKAGFAALLVLRSS